MYLLNKGKSEDDAALYTLVLMLLTYEVMTEKLVSGQKMPWDLWLVVSVQSMLMWRRMILLRCSIINWSVVGIIECVVGHYDG